MATGARWDPLAKGPDGKPVWNFEKALVVLGRYVRKEPGASQSEAQAAIDYLAARPDIPSRAAKTRR